MTSSYSDLAKNYPKFYALLSARDVDTEEWIILKQDFIDSLPLYIQKPISNFFSFFEKHQRLFIFHGATKKIFTAVQFYKLNCKIIFMRKYIGILNKIRSRKINCPELEKVLTYLLIGKIKLTNLNGKGVLFFPNKSKRRPINTNKRVKNYFDNILYTDFPQKIKIIKLKEALEFRTKRKINLPTNIFQYGNEISSEDFHYLVELHRGSRRNRCRIPADVLFMEIKQALTKDDTIINEVYDKYKRKFLPELFIQCPVCKKHNIHLNFMLFSTFAQKINRKEVKEVQLLYNENRDRAIRRTPWFHSTECLSCTHPKPFFFKISNHCFDCVVNFRNGRVTNFHSTNCVKCGIEVCGICSKPKDQHNLEQEFCPRIQRITEEERVEGRKNGFLFCRVCDQAIEWTDGCPHLKCPKCHHHFCGNCEEALPLKTRGIQATRYDHVCVQGGRANIYFQDAIEAINEGVEAPLGLPEYNPAINHELYDNKI
jgi:hypothetical protein